jgi:hypothetical protein
VVARACDFKGGHDMRAFPSLGEALRAGYQTRLGACARRRQWLPLEMPK